MCVKSDKNPTGANEVMKAIVENPSERAVLIILNDNDQDGKDVSWIWDAHFELLLNNQTKQIICSGRRAYDMALRMKYQGYEDGLTVIENIEDAIIELKKFKGDHFVVSTYTALQTARTILRRNAA